MLYPKLHSLYKREGFDFPETGVKPKHGKLLIGEYTCPEFEAIQKWSVTEKVDGTNVRIIFDKTDKREGAVHHVTYGGRTDNAQMPTFLLRHLQDTFTFEKMAQVFKESNYTVLFGEGYGPKIQSGGYYRKDASFILFDVYCSGWWLDRDGVKGVAESLGIEHCKVLYQPKPKEEGTVVTPYWTTKEIVDYVSSKPDSILAQDKHEMEGVVARSEPVMMFRKGGPIMFKLKCKDM
jgi:ATP-dependent RNA circularization protein (DNA/RNA ligase family)